MSIELLEDQRIELNVAVFALGLLILVVGLARDLLNAKIPASVITVAMLVGIILGPNVLDLVGTNKISNMEVIVQEICRLVIAIQLMAIALNIPFHYLMKAWKTQIILLTVVVALMWLTSGFIIYGIFQSTPEGMYKFSIWESLLIGAAVAPTDPVLASAVSTSALAISQVPARLRHTITAESGLNDGTGYPFVILCVRFLTQKHDSTGTIIGQWIVEDILWEIVLAIIIALIAGFAIGKVLVWAEPAKLHDQQLLVALTVALAFAFVGGAHLLGVNGLILVVVGGVVYARVVEGDKRGTESQLQETVDLIFSTLVFAVFGLTIPFDRWYLISWWRGLILCLALAVFRRVPWIIILKPVFKEQIHSIPDALFVGWFGPVGVGAIFYALFSAEELGEDRIWVVVSLVVFSQVIIFGVTDTFFTKWYATTNPNYVRRRRRKRKVIERAETQIGRIQESLVQQLESMPASPNMVGESPAWETQIPDLDLGVEYPGSPGSIELGVRSHSTEFSEDGHVVRSPSSASSMKRSESTDLRASRGEHVTFNLDAEYDTSDSGIRHRSAFEGDPSEFGTGNENETGILHGNEDTNSYEDDSGPRTFLGTSQSILKNKNEGQIRKNTSFHDFSSVNQDLRSSSPMRRSSLPARDNPLAKSSYL